MDINKLKLHSLSLSQEDINILLDCSNENIKPSKSKHYHKDQKHKPTDKLEIERDRAKYLASISELQSKLNEQVKANQLLQTKFDALSKSRNNPLAANKPLPNPEIEILKSNLYNIVPSDIQYVNIQAIPESSRSLLDAVRAKVYEEVNTVKNELYTLRRKSDVYESIEKEIEALRHRNRALEEDLKLKNARIAEYEGKLHTTEHELSVQRSIHEDYKRRNQINEDAINRIDALVQNVALCERRLEEAEEEKKGLLISQRDLQRDKEELLRELDIVKLDKIYLTKEVQTLNDRCAAMDQKLTSRTAELEKAKESQLIHFQSVLQQSEKQRNEYQSRLEEELSSIRKRNTLELDEIKRNGQNVYEKEIQTLKDQIYSTKDDLKFTKTALNKLRNTHEEYKQNYLVEKTKFESEITSLLQQLKMKSFEHDRIKVIYDETIHSLKLSQLEYEKANKKIDILTKELHHVQSESQAKISELELLANARLQKLLIVGGEDVIVAPERPTVKKFGDVRITIEELKSQNEKLKAEIRVLEDLLSKSREPVSAFVNVVKEKEMKIQDLKQFNENLQEQNKILEADKKDLQRERNSLLADFAKLKQNRQDMIQIRQLLSDILSKRKSINEVDTSFLHKRR